MGKDSTGARSPQRKLIPDTRRTGQDEPTSLREIANGSGAGDGHDLRGSECNRGTGCGKTARPGLGGGRRVTGVPTAAMVELVRVGRSPEDLTQEFEPTAQSIRNWACQADP